MNVFENISGIRKNNYGFFFPDLVSEYLQYQEATAEDDDDDEEVDRYDNDLEQEDAD